MAKNRFIVDFLFGAKKQGSFDKTFSAVSNSVKSLTKTVAGVAATYVSAQALKNVSMSALESASSLEGYRSTLNVVMKDQKKAAQMMAWAVDFANKTPFETDSVVEATVRLQSYGIDAQAPFLQVVDDFHVSVSFSGIAHAVIIEVEFCFRIGFICILEGERYVFLT